MSEVVERAKKALEGVTEGPWTFGVRNSRTVQIVPGDRPSLLRCEPGLAGIALARPNDATFIAEARTLVPDLVAELEATQRLLDDLTDSDIGEVMAHRDELFAERNQLLGRVRALESEVSRLGGGVL